MMLLAHMIVLLSLTQATLPLSPSAQNVEFPVEHQRLLQKHRGTLVITPDRIEYRADHQNESRSWRYQDIQQLKIESPTALEIITYEDQARMLGRDRVFKFRLLEGKITPEISALLIARSTRPLTTSVMPAAGHAPRFETQVKHLHPLGGCEGRLRIYPDRVTYESTDNPMHSRYWRYPDIQHFSHPTRYRFAITTFEEKFGGPVKVYDFQLKEDLPDPTFDYVWVRVNPVELYPYPKTAAPDALAVNQEAGRQADQQAAPDVNSQADAGPPNPERIVDPAPDPVPSPRSARQEPGRPQVQTAKVILKEQGYEPDSIRLRRGVPARVTFVRQVEGTCGSEIVLPEHGIKRALPLNKSVVVEFVPNKSGEFSFTCGMGMLRGKVIVQEK